MATFGPPGAAETYEQELMKMRHPGFRLALLQLLFLVAVCGFASQTRARQVSDPAPQGPKLQSVVYEGDMAALLRHLAAEFDVTIGFEVDPRQPKPQIKFKAQDVTFHEMLDAIVQAQPAYRWRREDGFIDFYPAEGQSPLLNIVVQSFEVSDASWAEAGDALLSLPEVRSGISALGLSRRVDAPGPAGRSDKLISLRLENVPVRRALHEMAKGSGGRFWAFRRYGRAEKFFTLNKF